MSVNPDELEVGKQYVMSYGSRQFSGQGRRERHITMNRVGDTSECDLYKGRNPKPGVWVTDHSDNDIEKFFVKSRIVYVRGMKLDELI